MEYDLSTIVSLISRIRTQTAEFLERRLREEGLPDLASSHGNILFQLSKFGPLSMGETAQKINRDKSTATALVKKLEEAELVKKEACASDSRTVMVSLTEKGSLYTRKTAALSEELLATFFCGFKEGEKSALLTLLRKAERNFTREGFPRLPQR